MDILSIPNSPFKLVKHNEKHFIAIGNQRITEPTEDKEYLINMVEYKDWEIIINTIIALIQIHK